MTAFVHMHHTAVYTAAAVFAVLTIFAAARSLLRRRRMIPGGNDGDH